MATLIAVTYEDELLSLNDIIEYITNSDTIIFSTNFNNKLDIELLSNYTKIIFSDYPLVSEKYAKKNLFIRYEIGDFSDFSHRFSTDVGLYDSLFNQEVNHLPSSITHLTFGKSFNKEVNNLPYSITHLTFGETFNQKIDYLPSSITHLTFGKLFNQEVNNLPPSITHLTFRY